MVVECVATLASCSSKKYIGVQSGTTGQYFVDGDEEWGFDGLEGYEAKGYNNAGLAVKDLKSGAVKYVITDAAPAKELAKAIDGVKVIDIDDLLGDKLTAFAPNTIGVKYTAKNQFGRPKSTEIIKQLYDCAYLANHYSDLDRVTYS